MRRWLIRLVGATALGGLLFAAASNVSAADPTPSGPVSGNPWALPMFDGSKLDLLWIPPGTFTMGSPEAEAGREADESPPTIVTLSRGFWLGRTEVTVSQWRDVMKSDLRGHVGKILTDDTLYDFGGRRLTIRDYMGMARDAPPETYLANEGDDLPMYFVSWNDAIEFCRQLTLREKAAGRLPNGYDYTLPTEAQWEYACRAGSTQASGTLTEMAWFAGNSAESYEGKTLPRARAGPRRVGAKRPNAWGLCDMKGNLWEWCRDWYGPYPGGSAVDPQGPDASSVRVNRGGSWGSDPASERPAKRAGNPPAEASAYRGFRVALCAAP